MSSETTPATQEEIADPSTGAGVSHGGAADLLLFPAAVSVHPGEADFRPGCSSPPLQTERRRGIDRLTMGMSHVSVHPQKSGQAY